MSLIFITGNSGSGKSTLVEELLQRGYKAYDTDLIAAFYDRKSGKKTVGRRGTTHAWHERHDWKISLPKIRKLAKEAEHQTIYLCGGASNEAEILPYVAKIFYLDMDAAELRKRLTTRSNNTYGKYTDELERALKWHREIDSHYHALKAVFIDATLPTSRIIDRIIKES